MPISSNKFCSFEIKCKLQAETFLIVWRKFFKGLSTNREKMSDIGQMHSFISVYAGKVTVRRLNDRFIVPLICVYTSSICQPLLLIVEKK